MRIPRGRAIWRSALLVALVAAGSAGAMAIVCREFSGAAWTAVGILGLIGLGVGLAAARSRQLRLIALTDAVEAMTAGRLDSRVRAPADAASDDAVAELAHALANLQARLRALGADSAGDRSLIAGVLTHMDAGIIIVDADERVRFANPAARRILELEARDARGTSLVATLRDHQLVQYVRARMLAPVGGTTGTRDAGVYAVGPGRQHLRVQVTGLDGDRWLVGLQDITEIRRAETIRRDFVANVSHELRTPLASMRALVETLRDGAMEDPPAAQRFLQRMEMELDGLTQLVLELLELSRIESGRVALSIEPVDVRSILGHVVERLLAQSERAGVTLAVRVQADVNSVPADPGKLQQALTNLVHNAIKFTPSGGNVKVSADPAQVTQDGRLALLTESGPARPPTHIVLSVADTGIGIDPEDQPRIFERFYRVDRARTGGGTGLGLAIVKHVAEAHGGRVWVESIPGRGTTFRLALPLASPHPRGPEPGTPA